MPDYSCYLVHILAHLTEEDERVRAVAGLILKNNAKTIKQCTPDVVAYVKPNVLVAFTSPTKSIRDAAGQVIVTLLGVFEVIEWPEALMQLMQSLDSPDPVQQTVRLSFPPRILSFLKVHLISGGS